MNEATTALQVPDVQGDIQPREQVWTHRLAMPCLAAREWMALVILSALALAFRLWDIGQRGFWLDELSAVGTSALSFADLMQALTVEANMTLYYWVLFVWLRIVGFGASEGLIRALSAVLGTAAVPLVYLLGRRLHSPVAGLAAAGLLAVNGFHVLMSQEARAYAALSTLTVGSYLLLDRALQRRGWRDWVFHAVVTSLAFYCHFYTVFTILAQGLFVVSRRSRAALIGLVVSGLVMAILLAQLVPFFIRQSHGAKLSHLVPPDAADLLDFLVNYGGASLPALVLYVALAAVGCFAAGGARPRVYRNTLLLTWFCLPLGLALAISVVRPIFNDRYLFAVLPALPLLAGIGLARLPRPAGLSTFVFLGGLSVWALQGDLEARRAEQWREAVSYATSNARPGDGWIFVSKWGQNGFEYYAGWRWGTNPAAPYADVFEPFDWREAYTVPKYRGVLSLSDLDRFAAGHPRIWLVLSHEFDGGAGGPRAEPVDTSAPVRDWLTRHGYSASQRQFRFVRALLYQRRG